MSEDLFLVQSFQQRQRIYRTDPVRYWSEVLNFKADPWQQRAAYDLVEQDRLSIKSGSGVGKTAFEAASLLWFLPNFPYARVVATAPTRQQLHDILWSEVAKWMAGSPLLSAILRWTKTYVYMTGMEKIWFGVAKTASTPEAMQGFHSDNMLIVIDEASGVADDIIEALEATLMGGNNKLAMFGNPNKVSGIFYRSHTKDRDSYATQTVNALNVERTNKKNIESLIRRYGEKSNIVRVKVFGEFPLAEDDVFISLSLVEQSINTEPRTVKKVVGGVEQRVQEAESIHIACDVARFGDDKTIIGYRVNEVAKFHKKIHGQDLMTTAKEIALLGLQLVDRFGFKGKIPVKIDDGGLGGGVTDKLREMKKEDPARFDWMVIVPVNFGRTIKHKYYHDSTSYMMGIVKSLLATEDDEGNKKQVELVLPDDDEMTAQFSTRKYSFNQRGKIVVESKKAMKERGLPSPDEADCVLLLCLPVRMDRKKEQAI